MNGEEILKSAGQMDETALARVLAYIDEERDRRCAEILNEASREAEQFVGDAHSRARELVHRAVTGEKQRRDREIRRMRAEVRRRLRDTWFSLMRRELDQAWPEVGAGLIRHWNASKENRLAWLAATVEMAAHALGPGLWHLAHPDSWHMEEGEPVFDDIRRQHEDLRILGMPSHHEAGFQVSCSDVSVSTTLAGLFSQRERIEGLWLAMLHERGVLALPELNEECFE